MDFYWCLPPSRWSRGGQSLPKFIDDSVYDTLQRVSRSLFPLISSEVNIQGAAVGGNQTPLARSLPLPRHNALGERN